FPYATLFRSRTALTDKCHGVRTRDFGRQADGPVLRTYRGRPTMMPVEHARQVSCAVIDTDAVERLVRPVLIACGSRPHVAAIVLPFHRSAPRGPKRARRR